MKKRSLENYIKKISSFYSVLLLTGPRQTGKTTLLKMCSDADRKYVTLDTFENRSLAQNDPELFLQRYKPPVLIDEIQYAPNLLPYIKSDVDSSGNPGDYWLTGSQQFLLMKNLSESLAGRVAVLSLQGFSQEEKMQNFSGLSFLPSMNYIQKKESISTPMDLMQVYHEIWKGSYPKLCCGDDWFWQSYYDSYIQTYIERDIRQLLNVGNEIIFQHFMQVLASRTGNLLNYADIARDVGIALSTAKSWISVLETSGIIFLLRPYFNNLTNRAIKTPKIYFFDTGLVSFLCGWTSAQTLERGSMSGNIFENYCVSEIMKSYLHNGKNPAFYYYRDKDNREIDLLIEENGVLYPVEIKKKSNPDKDDIKSFGVIENVLKKERGEGAVVCMASTHLPITENVTAVPVWYI